MSTSCRRPLVGRRNVRQGVRSVALCLPGDRPVRAGHRRVCVPAARWRRGPVFFTRALATTKVVPVEVTTDKAAVYPHVLDELAPGAWHCTELYANNRMEADHGQLKRRLRPMRGLKTDHGARIIIAGHAFIQNIRRGHYELGVDEPMTLRVAAAFDELALAI
jgi:hypothetical protein